MSASRWLTPDDWRPWLTAYFSRYIVYGFAQRHVDLWQWAWSIENGTRPRPFVAVWPRGGGKSSTSELVACAIGLRNIRRYAVYVSTTQDQADKHVGSIAALLEHVGANRAVNRYGSSKGWRRDRLTTENGFTIDALGLDTAARGIKFEEARPGFIFLDDIDELHDQPAATKKKIETLTNTILPAGSGDCAVLGVQNLIHSNSTFARLVDGRADFLTDRIVSGPFAAVDGLQYVQTPDGIRITGGTPTWEGQDLVSCENTIRTSGLSAFLRESQQEVNIERVGALWTRDLIEQFRVSQAPDLSYIVVAIDPAATSRSTSNEAGIIVAGATPQLHGYVLGDYSKLCPPSEWATRAICAYIVHKANKIVGEGNNGGEMIETVIRGIEAEAVADELERWGYPRSMAISGKHIPYEIVWASDGKRTRAEPVQMVYSQGRVHHVGSFPVLESEMCTWVPVESSKSPNRIDALVWALSPLAAYFTDPAAATVERRAPHAARPKSSWQR